MAFRVEACCEPGSGIERWGFRVNAEAEDEALFHPEGVKPSATNGYYKKS